MYKVFVNELPLILTNKLSDTTNGEYFLLNQESIQLAISSLKKGKLKEAFIYHPSHDEILKKFTKEMPLVIAGGGVVSNNKGEVLFIYRNDKWDLPKGKLDKGESIEECAIREVEEETGVKGLSIDHFLQTTYHVFRHNGINKLKQVHWYAMSTDYDGKLKPEKKEGIFKVKWKGPAKIKKALENSYVNIKILFQED
ncbi:NUDIX domain-containing protein [Maribacter spongiicola]|uniref:NUDIX domain-containing protein n=1 Tax=Maribacter spongiicola TaxID=1206753 RepID=A0A4R7JQN0_9FLAO|nr:NUDIX hydrolase [Maribacter spongiicola]TDT39577.1 NUDIX domain-containing protein [Maribacter spongiicola]